eukprot:TRINITY_DN8893_c0_g2_i1.p1 TRINITY_DN8893_c0_g2~~TRINITY_DN8893_c0_g2_i1.p1  ORF type:complete len:108 (-),score=22.73 TRINITY_DN8893_c0_g2_i1:29-352(-)
MLVGGAFVHRLRSMPRGFELRDFFSVAKVKTIEVLPSILSKANTALQLALGGLTLITAAYAIPDTYNLYPVLWWTVACTTMGSGLDYWFSARKVMSVLSDEERKVKK